MSPSAVLERANEERIREIAAEVAREQIEALRKEMMEGELAKLRRDLNLQMERVWRAIGELADAQKRTEERVGRLETIVAELAEAQKRTEERLGRLETIVAELAEAQKRTEERVGHLETIVAELVESQKRTEERVRELAEAQKRTEERIGRLETTVSEVVETQKHIEQRLTRVENNQARLLGNDLERSYREKAPAYFGRLLRRVRVISWQEVEDDLETHLSDDEIDEIVRLDLIVSGRLREHPKRAEALLAIEVSNVIDRRDVERAVRRAGLLRKAGLIAIPTVAGEAMTEGARELVKEQHVLVVLDGGRRLYWPEALANALKESPG